jgi:hypothetical protein
MTETKGIAARLPARRVATVILLSVSLGGFGCAARQPPEHDGSRWPGAKRWGSSAANALRDPRTWAPAAGAGLILVADWDEGISDWAVLNTPVFGSPVQARDTSDYLEGACYLSMVSTAIAAPRGERPWDSKLGRLAVDHMGLLATQVSTGLIKEVSGRERPNGSNDQSFPSGHSSRSFSNVALAWRNLDAIPMSGGARTGLKAGFEALAAGTAWARVEAGAHYLSDVLVGAALGNFVALLVHDAFLPPAVGRRPEVEVSLLPDGAMVTLRWDLDRFR